MCKKSFVDESCPLSNGDMCPIYKRRIYKPSGRRLSLSDEQLRIILEYFQSSEKTQKIGEFCVENHIKARTYRNIINGRIKNKPDRERIDRIAESYGLKIRWDSD